MHYKFNENTTSFFKALLSYLIGTEVNKLSGELNNQSSLGRVIIGDSTKFAIHKSFAGDYPSFGGSYGNQALMNIQHSFDIKNNKLISFKLCKATDNDQSYVPYIIEDVQAKDLLISDIQDL